MRFRADPDPHQKVTDPQHWCKLFVESKVTTSFTSDIPSRQFSLKVMRPQFSIAPEKYENKVRDLQQCSSNSILEYYIYAVLKLYRATKIT